MQESVEKESSIVEVGHEKTCECKENHLNCLKAKEWIKHQLGVWQFNYGKRDIRDKKIHPATFPISLAQKCIGLFTHEGELVVDPFNGVGTTLLAAQDLNRNAIGLDIHEEYCEFSDDRLKQLTLGTSKQVVICDDARNICNYIRPETISFSLTSPPYANLLNRKRLNKSRRSDLRKNEQYLKVEQYSQDSRDLGTMPIDEFEKVMSEIYAGILPLVKPRGNVVVNVADVWWEGQRVSIHIHIIRALEKAGFTFKNTIIWDRTNIVNRIGIFGWPSNYITMGTTYEYLLNFWKV